MATVVDVPQPIGGQPAVPYPLTAVDYYPMVESAIIPADRPVFLWDGRLFEKMAKEQPHAIAHSKLARILFENIPADRWYVSTENPVELAADKVPLPDLAVIRGRPDDYPATPPKAGDVAMIVQVMDTSLGKDLGSNRQAHAAANVPVYWVVNLRSRSVEVYTEPAPLDREGASPHWRRCRRTGLANRSLSRLRVSTQSVSR
jgi:hypothetical protein